MIELISLATSENTWKTNELSSFRNDLLFPPSIVTVVTLCQSGGGFSGGTTLPSILQTWLVSPVSTSDWLKDPETDNSRNSPLTIQLIFLVFYSATETHNFPVYYTTCSNTFWYVWQCKWSFVLILCTTSFPRCVDIFHNINNIFTIKYT